MHKEPIHKRLLFNNIPASCQKLASDLPFPKGLSPQLSSCLYEIIHGQRTSPPSPTSPPLPPPVTHIPPSPSPSPSPSPLTTVLDTSTKTTNTPTPPFSLGATPTASTPQASDIPIQSTPSPTAASNSSTNDSTYTGIEPASSGPPEPFGQPQPNLDSQASVDEHASVTTASDSQLEITSTTSDTLRSLSTQPAPSSSSGAATSSQSHVSLRGGAIAGIVVGVTIFLIIGVVCVFARRRKKILQNRGNTTLLRESSVSSHWPDYLVKPPSPNVDMRETQGPRVMSRLSYNADPADADNISTPSSSGCTTTRHVTDVLDPGVYSPLTSTIAGTPSSTPDLAYAHECGGYNSSVSTFLSESPGGVGIAW
ncbi:unnamed protein product [Somion occarium]|uniref:Uncharacterized protein n=1 Tax=Somion occarium TaxID=3059160 RepID=A0ABP1DUS7_9APHY